ncbi:PIR protein [Plasmodium vivax]|uniref:VIR protein n=1 Tax=Plasmodium vivax TaxID=5855 RepID=A0A565A439_PLAVI|nr:PIR protein [Plasmodium vivax]
MMELSKLFKELEVMSNLSFRDELYSEILYKTLHNLKELNDYSEVCSPLGQLKSGKSIKIICARVLKYLETVYKETYKKGDPYNVCLLLSFWVYSRLFDILPNENYVYPAYAQLQSIWTGFLEDKSYNELCKPIADMVSHKDWRKRKELYEYYVNYSPTKKIVDEYQQRCNELYVYVENKAGLYEHFKSRCPNDNTNICPEFYTYSKEYHPDKVLSTLDCHQKIISFECRIARQRGNTPSDSEAKSRETSDGMIPFILKNFTKIINLIILNFTPLGNMLRNRFGWNTNNMSNINGGDIRLYDYASESFNPYSGGAEEHYIGYHPA